MPVYGRSLAGTPQAAHCTSPTVTPVLGSTHVPPEPHSSPYRQYPPCGHMFWEPGQQVQFVPGAQQLGPVPQWVLPEGQAQVPFWQVKSPLQIVPQLPQFCLLLLVVTQVPLQRVCPLGQEETHAPHLQLDPHVCLPPLQVCVLPGVQP